MRFLIAEDNEALGTFLKRGLEADGHEVRVAADGQAAVDSFLEADAGNGGSRLEYAAAGRDRGAALFPVRDERPSDSGFERAQ